MRVWRHVIKNAPSYFKVRPDAANSFSPYVVHSAAFGVPSFPESGKARKVTHIVKMVEVVEKPRPRELINIYTIVKAHRPDITEAETWRVSEVISKESAKRKIDPLLVLAVIEIESRFQYSDDVAGRCARHHANHARHRQVFDAQRWDTNWALHPVAYRPESLDDPILNIRMGVYYLHDLRKQFRNLHLALIAYNAGPAEVQNRLENNQEFSQEYATLVLDAYKRYTNRKAPTF